MFHPKNSPGRIFSFSLPARPEAQSALQGRGIHAQHGWWGHEVLKGPNTLADIQFPVGRKYRNGGFGVADFPLPYFYRTCNCCPWLLQSIGCRRCPHHRACARSPSPHREDLGRADHLFFLYPKACGSRTAFGVRQDPFWRGTLLAIEKRTRPHGRVLSGRRQPLAADFSYLFSFGNTICFGPVSALSGTSTSLKLMLRVWMVWLHTCSCRCRKPKMVMGTQL